MKRAAAWYPVVVVLISANQLLNAPEATLWGWNLDATSIYAALE